MNVRNTAEIISIGTELLRGEIVDTNASYLASQLPLLGIELHRVTTAGDNQEQLCTILSQALERSSLVVTSGGLGPTEDDLTRECIAAILGEVVYVDPELESQLRERFRRIGAKEMPPHNIKQAWLVPSAKSLDNPRGTAPGWWVETGGKVIVALPGPPREMTLMWEEQVKPRLKLKFPTGVILSKTVKTIGFSEGKVAELVQPLFDTENPSMGIYARPDGIHLRLIAHGSDAERLLQIAEERLRGILGSSIWGKDDDSLERIIGRSLTGKGLTLATMEDSTGGLISSFIAKTPGSSEYYRGGLVTRSDDIKVDRGVPANLISKYGAISAEMAKAMAEAVRKNFSTDFGLSTTGVGGANDSDGKTPGLTYIGIADAAGQKSWEQNYSYFHDEAGHREAIGALFRLRERLIELGIGSAQPGS